MSPTPNRSSSSKSRPPRGRKLRQVRYGNHVIEYAVVRRKRKTLEIAVEPDTGVVVVAPLDAELDAIAGKIRKRARWILSQQRSFERFMPRTPPRRYVSGETHRYLGRQYRLKVRKGEASELPGVSRTRGYITVRSPRPRCPDTTRRMVERWYRTRARRVFHERTEANLARFPDSEAFRPRGLIVRALTRRWGSMTPSCNLVLALRLIEAPLSAIDYVITHELCHIAEPRHNARFFALLDRVMPNWPARKERLERHMA